MSWPTLSSQSSAVVRRCVAFPCEPHLLSSAVDAVRSAGTVNNVYYWRERQYCICEVRPPAVLFPLLNRHQQRNWAPHRRGMEPFPLLHFTPRPTTPSAAPVPRCRPIEMTEAPVGDAMLQLLSSFRSLSAQILALESALRPHTGDLLLRALYVHSLETALTSLLPEARLKVFGSLVSGLWTKNGDLDIAVEFGQRVDAPNLRIQKMLQDMKETRLLTLKRLMLIIDGSFSSIVAILNTRAPILRIGHTSGLKIDLSVVDEASPDLRRTSLLFRALMEGSVCPELRPLSLFLKWHLRHCKHFSVGDSLSGFKLTTLVMFFLQQRRLLPPLQPLMDDLAAGRPLAAPSRTLQPELLGGLFRDLLAFLVDLCHQRKVFFDIRTGWSGGRSDAERYFDANSRLLVIRSAFVCPEPHHPEMDIMNVNLHTVNRLRVCCLGMILAMREGSSYQPDFLNKSS